LGIIETAITTQAYNRLEAISQTLQSLIIFAPCVAQDKNYGFITPSLSICADKIFISRTGLHNFDKRISTEQ